MIKHRSAQKASWLQGLHTNESRLLNSRPILLCEHVVNILQRTSDSQGHNIFTRLLPARALWTLGQCLQRLSRSIPRTKDSYRIVSHSSFVNVVSKSAKNVSIASLARGNVVVITSDPTRHLSSVARTTHCGWTTNSIQSMHARLSAWDRVLRWKIYKHNRLQ